MAELWVFAVVWFAAVGYVISSPRLRDKYLAAKRWILGLGGSVFVLAGGRLAFED